MDKPFDPTKPVQTRSGLKARIICTDKSNDTSYHIRNREIVGLVTNSQGFEGINTYFDDGKVYSNIENPNDLVNIPEVTKKYYRTYYTVGNGSSDKSPQVTSSAELSEQAARDNRNKSGGYKYIGILEYVFTDGVVTDVNFIPW